MKRASHGNTCFRTVAGSGKITRDDLKGGQASKLKGSAKRCHNTIRDREQRVALMPGHEQAPDHLDHVGRLDLHSKLNGKILEILPKGRSVVQCFKKLILPVGWRKYLGRGEGMKN